MSEKNKKYILCPRCELNYIEEDEGYCKVCKAAMGLVDPGILIPEEDEMTGEKLCPICHENYIGEDEDICFICKREKEEKERSEESGDEWRSFVDDDVSEEDGTEDISLSELAEEEEEGESDERAPEDEENAEPDDFDFLPVDPDDFADDDEEDEDDEDSDDSDDLDAPDPAPSPRRKK